MARKNRTFPKNKLVSFFKRSEYQKVISKIKQFTIAGMTQDKVNEMMIVSYEKLSDEHFQNGDIARALRDLESLLQIDDSENYRLLKLKYLCYLEHFDEAIVLGQLLLNSKNSSLKKEAAFYYLLAKVYSGEAEIEAKLLRMLPVSRKNYLLGFQALMLGQDAEAIEFFDATKPRAKIEKLNLEAFKSLLSGKSHNLEMDSLKPLYRFLLSGDDTALQNSKNVREFRQEINNQFAHVSKEKGVQDLLSLTRATTLENIKKYASSEEEEIKLVSNNIALLMEKQQFTEAWRQFSHYHLHLANLQESLFLFLAMSRHYDVEKNAIKLVIFLEHYLPKHQHKLSPFVMEYLFYAIFVHINNPDNVKTEERFMALARKNGIEHFSFLWNDYYSFDFLQLNNKKDKDMLVAMFGDFSYTKENLIAELAKRIDNAPFSYVIEDIPPMQHKIIVEELIFKIQSLQNIREMISLKYQKSVITLLSSFAKMVHAFDIKKDQKIYAVLKEVVLSFTKIYHLKQRKLPIDIKALFVAVDENRNLKQDDDDDDDFFFFRRVLKEGRDLYDFDEEEFDFADYKQEFVEILKAGRDLSAFLTDFSKKYVDNSYTRSGKYLQYVLDFIVISETVQPLSVEFIQMVIKNTRLISDARYDRADIPDAIYAMAYDNSQAALIVLKILLDNVFMKEYVWYMNWLYTYLEIVKIYDLTKDSNYYETRKLFIKIQKKKKFKSMNKRYQKVLQMPAGDMSIVGQQFLEM